MSIRTLLSASAGLSIALIAAPAGALHAQTSQDSAADRIYRTNVPRYPQPPGAAAQVGGQAVADSTFVREARAGNLFEVRAGTLAGFKASNSAVKQFASRMVSDHTKLGDQWSSLGDRLGVKAKAELDATQQQAMSRLQGTSTAEFDRAYMSEMVQDHQNDVAAFQRMAQQAQSPALRQLASSSLTTIQQHLTLAQQVAGQVGAGAVATNVPSPLPSGDRRVTSQGGKVATSELREDKDYINKVDEGFITQVRLAQIAQPKVKDPKVKQFAKNLENDLRPRRDRWDALAADVGLPNRHPLPEGTAARLKTAGPGEADRVYLNLVTDNLSSLISSLEKEGPQAHATRVRDLAKDQLPDLRQHLSRAQDLARQHKQK